MSVSLQNFLHGGKSGVSEGKIIGLKGPFLFANNILEMVIWEGL